MQALGIRSAWCSPPRRASPPWAHTCSLANAERKAESCPCMHEAPDTNGRSYSVCGSAVGRFALDGSWWVAATGPGQGVGYGLPGFPIARVTVSMCRSAHRAGADGAQASLMLQASCESRTASRPWAPLLRALTTCKRAAGQWRGTHTARRWDRCSRSRHGANQALL